ncbi:unnamed protein product [Tuber melanosporum]|uniref:tRNA(His) guanylyltransferase n=1 Tax=Tuber melanosporum (strain Mel28) TaxID=656061 RepID=D5G6K2_TUBMM|nr:uncharacterized protein GSTUM_00004516001 [Tuber melanosporum]CAZ80145.1 unnamed protein product [Tuber melanosporum]
MADMIPLAIRCHRVVSRSNRILPTLTHHHMTQTATRKYATKPAPPSPPTTDNNHRNDSNPPPKAGMANSKYEYTRTFEDPRRLLPNTYIILRLDGRSFSTFSATQNFKKPNDPRALQLMNASAAATLRTLTDIRMAYGVSDEFSFLLPRECTLFDRREDKLVSTVVSTFTGWYVFLWQRYFGGGDAAAAEEGEGESLRAPPSFDCRAVCYPSVGNVRDYFAWRQADAHVNNLFNTAFWTLVIRGGVSRRDAEAELRGTFAADKNELLFSRFGINYNNEPEMYRKGSVVYRDYRIPEDEGAAAAEPTLTEPLEWSEREGEEGEERETTAVPKFKSKTQKEKERKLAKKARIVTEHVDIIGDEFWQKRPWLLGNGN